VNEYEHAEPGQPLVADHVHRRPVLVRDDASLGEAARLMDEHHVHGLPVVDAAGRLAGVLSQTDLNRARSTEYLWAHWPGLVVRHLMSSPAVTVRRTTPLIEAARMMERHAIHRLVVVEDGDELSPVGVLSMSDLIHSRADETRPAGGPMTEEAATSGDGAGPDALDHATITEAPR
jgi:CBS domain-containing protein